MKSVRADFFRRSPKSPHQIAALPVVIWARLYMDLEPYLAHRRADGADLMGFYHRQMAEAAVAKYLGKERHAGLAAYFTPQPLYLQGGEAVPNLRKLSEMVYQQARAGLPAQVEGALLHYPYLQAKLAGQGVQALIEDYALAPIAGVEGEEARSLSLVQGALRLSAHVLGKDTSQLAGQLTGRLLDSAAPATKRLLDRIREEQAGPWLRPLTPGLATAGGTLVRTLSAEFTRVLALAVLPDGRRAVSGSSQSLKVWDLESGAELATLSGHTGDIHAVAVTPDGLRAVSGSDDKTLRVWNLESGAECATLGGHTSRVTAVAVTRDGRRAVSGSEDETLKVWDISAALNAGLGSGAELATLYGNCSQVYAVAVTHDGRRVVFGSSDNTLKVWDIPALLPAGRESGDQIATLRGHSGAVNAVAVTPDGLRAVSGSYGELKVWDLGSGAELVTLAGRGPVALTSDGRRAVSGSDGKTLKVWDIGWSRRERELVTLKGHTQRVNAVAVTPDGRRAVSASDDQTLKVWDLGSGTELVTLRGHTEPCHCRGGDARRAAGGVGVVTRR